ncbi:MAG TPA: nucleotidyltransferase family protein, partial [Chthonomonadaceae bacterium]|nr:nucleotidyltransferase family protein [Chthonomonadaceae bacterium]
MRSEIPMERIDAVLPAGGRISGAFAREAGAEIKALIRLEGRTLLRRMIEALRATGRIGRIVVIGPEEALIEAQACGADAAISEGATGPENIYRGLEWLRAQEPAPPSRVLILTTDLPFITPEAIIAFLDSCSPDADIAIPIVTREAFEARFPGTESIYTHLRDGAFTLGCAFLVSLETVLRCRPQVEGAFQARKSQWQMA